MLSVYDPCERSRTGKELCKPLSQEKDNLFHVKNVLVDGGHAGISFAQSDEETLGSSVQIANWSELHAFVVIPERWVVGRSLGWLEKFRRLWKNWEHTLNSILHRGILAFIPLLLRRT